MANQRSIIQSIDEQLSTMITNAFSTESSISASGELLGSYPSSPLPLSAPHPTAIQDHFSSDTDDSRTGTLRGEYEIRTLGVHNMARLSILPMFPYDSLSSDATFMTTSHLLLSNVPVAMLTEEQYARLRSRAFPRLFQLKMENAAAAGANTYSEKASTNSSGSFMLYFYEKVYVKTRKQLKVDIPVIDFNLARLHYCVEKVAEQRGLSQIMLDTDELTLALEWYLQIDVDMVFFKTCSFNGAEPRLIDNHFRESVFCYDTPEPRFAIQPCGHRWCLCCHSPSPRHYASGSQQTLAIPFSIPHIHRFVNQYEAILNCTATCETSNCIYVLTCHCGQYDFIGASKMPFAQTLALHREEGNRIIREFLIGELNTHRVTHGLKSAEKNANDKLWLYQHSPRCSVAMQLFLDENPDYWCFVPMKLTEANTANATGSGHASAAAASPARSTVSSPSTAMMSISNTRSDEQVRSLVNNVPEPPFDFDFSNDQRQQQAYFFKTRQDRIVPLDNVDLYNANIVAVLPANSSDLFRCLIESLLITHAECKLNEIGHLVYENVDCNRSLLSPWCVNLTRRPVA